MIRIVVLSDNFPSSLSGDGGNDFCPCSSYLGDGDVALARTDFALSRRIKKHGDQLHSGLQVAEWASWSELAQLLESFGAPKL